jgi:hypothetical protein
MLVIREKQFQALYRSQFRFWLSSHLQQFFPAQCAAIGWRALQETIHHGLVRATARGFTTRELQTQFVDLTVVFGREFEQLPWARAILDDQALAPDAKMARLQKEAQTRLRSGTE